MYLGMDLTCSIKNSTLIVAGARDMGETIGINSHSDAQLTDREVQGRDESVKGNGKGKSIKKPHIHTKEEIEKNI